jgi:hypothetical protein
MLERLTESLIRGRKLTPEAAEEGSSRHLLMGGALDSALLELGAVDEQTVLEALPSAYGLASANARQLGSPSDARALRAFPEQWARKHLLAPVSLSPGGDALTVLSPAPADGPLLVRLGELLDLELRPLLAPEFRVHERLAALYGGAPPERYRTLLTRFGACAPAADGANDARSATPSSTPGSSRTAAPLSSSRAPITAPAGSSPPAATDGAGPRSETRTLSFGEAVTQLRQAGHRDEIVRTALQYAARHLELAAMLIHEDDRLSGWMGFGDGSEQLQGLTVELASDSAFRTVVETRAQYLGPLPATPVHARFLETLGRPSPHAVLILPVRLRSRVVALLYGDNGQRPLPGRLAADLTLFVTHVQLALESLLLRRKVESLAELGTAESVDLQLPPEPPAPAPAVVSSAATAQPAAAEADEPLDSPWPAEEVTELEFGEDLGAKLAPSAGTGSALDRELAALVGQTPEAHLDTGNLVARFSGEAFELDLPASGLTGPDARPQPGAGRRDEPVADDPLPELMFEPAVAAEDVDDGTMELVWPSPDAPVAPEPEPSKDTPRPVAAAPITVPTSPAPSARPAPTSLVRPTVVLTSARLAAAARASSLPVTAPAEPSDESWESVDLGLTPMASIEGGAPASVGSMGGSETNAWGEPAAATRANSWQEQQPLDRGSVLRAARPILEGPATATSPRTAPMLEEVPVVEGESWSTSPPDAWDRAWQGASADAASQLPATARQDAPRDVLERDATVPDLSAEAWMRASSDVVRARPLPPDVVERAGMPPEPHGPRASSAAPRRGPEPWVPEELREPSNTPTTDRAQELAAFGDRIPNATTDILSASLSSSFDDEPLPLLKRTGSGPTTDLPQASSTLPAAPASPGTNPDRRPISQPRSAGSSLPTAHGAQRFEQEVEAALELLTHPDPGRRETAAKAVLRLGTAALPRLAERFPGLTHVDPFLPGASLPRFARCGHLLSVIEQHGVAAHPLVARKLEAPEPLARFFAVYFYAAVKVPEAIPRLIPRLHDEEARICMLAARTLFSYREHPDFALVLDHLHGRLDSGPVAARRHAAWLLGLFRDVGAIPKLIEILDKKERGLTEVAEDALAEITKQRLGASSRKWRTWWSRNQQRSRLAWLIDGLSAKDAVLRKSSAEELRAVTGLDFGFHEDAPRREREEARMRWVRWWEEQEKRGSAAPA